jgi:hypothetical protein
LLKVKWVVAVIFVEKIKKGGDFYRKNGGNVNIGA